MTVAKTTFHLDAELHVRLKETAARLGSSVRALLEEGARLALERHQGRGDRQRLERKADAAWVRLQRGYGPSAQRYTADTIDEAIYGAAGVGEPSTEWNTSSSTPGRSRRKRAPATHGTPRPRRRSRR